MSPRPSKSPDDYRRRSRKPLLWVPIIAAGIVGAFLVSREQDPYERIAEAHKRVGERVDCLIPRGKSLPPFNGNLDAVNPVTRRIIKTEAATPGTTLHNIVGGRPFALRDPTPTTAYDNTETQNEVVIGGSWVAAFREEIPVDAVVPETGYPPTGANPRYTRRLGYMPYRVHVTGRVRRLEVAVDARSGEVSSIHADDFGTYEPLDGDCPLRDEPESTGL